MPEKHEWRLIRGRIHERFYDDLVETAECGAFDGGCVVVANVLRRCFGGEVFVLTDAAGRAQHAVLSDGVSLMDYDGPAAPEALLERFNHTEMAACVSYREMAEGDLPGAFRDSALEDRLAGIVEEAMLEIRGPAPRI